MLSALEGLTGRASAALQRLASVDDLQHVQALYRTFDGFTERVRYNHLPTALLAALEAIRVQHRPEEPRLLRLLVLHAMTDSLARLADGRALPAPLVPVAIRTLTVLLRSLETETDERYHIGDDRYVKDIQVARLRLVPLGAQLLDTWRGYSRKSMLVGGGFAGAPRALLALVRHGGNDPWHEFHTYDLAMRFFSAKGWEESIRLCIPLLQQQPEVKGVFASAWWFDPALGRLTPNMAFPRDVSARFGAEFFPLPRDEESNELAVLRSPERAALVASGRYAPRPYLMLLPRATLLAHA